MEKNNKKISLTEIILLIFVLVSVTLILIDMIINLRKEINIQSQNNTSSIVMPTTLQLANSDQDWMLPMDLPVAINLKRTDEFSSMDRIKDLL
jgi:hypothetical protein